MVAAGEVEAAAAAALEVAATTAGTYPFPLPPTPTNSPRSNLSTGQILALVFSILGAILFGFILWRYWVWWRQQRDISAQALEYSGNRKSDRPYAIIVAEEDARKQGWWAEANGAGKKWWRGPGKRSKGNDVGAQVTAAGLLAGGLGGQ